ncbi:MAG: hypothetical protein M3457_17470 [Chloroflexota bacterium]|nr:hypothetical protein [Chloroflexota bacterium]
MFTDQSLVEGGARLYPRGIASTTPQHFAVASRPEAHITDQKFPTDPRRSRKVGAHRNQPRSVRFELAVP